MSVVSPRPRLQICHQDLISSMLNLETYLKPQKYYPGNTSNHCNPLNFTLGSLNNSRAISHHLPRGCLCRVAINQKKIHAINLTSAKEEEQHVAMWLLWSCCVFLCEISAASPQAVCRCVRSFPSEQSKGSEVVMCSQSAGVSLYAGWKRDKLHERKKMPEQLRFVNQKNRLLQ